MLAGRTENRRCHAEIEASPMPALRRPARGILGLLLAAVIATLLVAACSGPTQGNKHTPSPSPSRSPSPTPTPKRQAAIEFVGASVTAGWYASEVSKAYPTVATAALRLRGEPLTLRVRAIPGATVQDALTWDIHQRANIVIVHMGSNNFAKSDPLNVFTAQYHELITVLRQASPKADLVCLGEWHQPLIPDLRGDTPEDFDAVMSSQCKKVGGTFEPLGQVYAIAGNHGPLGTRTPFGRADLLHPNDVGEVAIAQMVLQGLEQQPPLANTFTG